MLLLKVQGQISFLVSVGFWRLAQQLVCGCINLISSFIFLFTFLPSESFFTFHFLKGFLQFSVGLIQEEFISRSLAKFYQKRPLFINKVTLTGFRHKDVGISFRWLPFKLLQIVYRNIPFQHSLLQGIFPTKGWNLGLLHYRQILY